MSDSSKNGVLALSGSLMGLSTIAVGLRFWARRRQKLRFLADDWIAGLALLSYIGASICVFVMVHNEVLGYSSHDFTSQQIAAMGRTDNVSEITLDVLTNNTLACVKLSALFFYRRIFCATEKRTIFGTATWVTIAIVILWLLFFQFLTGFQCGTHFSALWDGSYLQYCTISFPFLYGLVISDFLLDVWILALPIPGILRLHTTLRRKLGIIGVFLLALVGLGASIARMVQYIKVELGGPDYLLYTDRERLITQSFFYTMLEPGIALIAVNLPSLRVFSISLKAGEVIRSARSLLELYFLRDSSTDIVQNASEAPTTSGSSEYGKAGSFSSRPDERSNVLHKAFPES
ncbi:hypothetical protein GGS23DRAFT_510789 [Durotheca rogersii]|uniref:uncharacterized protein n=1 Tax=Durotheca rogersii TaxID=419775 RepID=UPI00221F3DF6|nr:uncharacterized protein GGS23DRAFT_510789 [Durotheca rogersii]KAI5863695.1 hypothetical protein GGS23DRAFT_510789 [Durotheca rogersii]